MFVSGCSGYLANIQSDTDNSFHSDEIDNNIYCYKKIDETLTKIVVCDKKIIISTAGGGGPM
jgi:hypothetical protein